MKTKAAKVRTVQLVRFVAYNYGNFWENIFTFGRGSVTENMGLVPWVGILQYQAKDVTFGAFGGGWSRLLLIARKI